MAWPESPAKDTSPKTRKTPNKLTMPPVAIECVMNIRREALAGNQELQSDVQRLDSGLVEEDQEPPDALNSLTEDDLPSEIPSSEVALRELEEFVRQHQQDPGPHSGKGAR